MSQVREQAITGDVFLLILSLLTWVPEVEHAIED